jgi:DNA repair exonuclease SbcCD ATPase subunit
MNDKINELNKKYEKEMDDKIKEMNNKIKEMDDKIKEMDDKIIEIDEEHEKKEMNDKIKELDNNHKNIKKKRIVKSGFAMTHLIPNKLAKFIGVEPGSEITGPEITKRVWNEFKNRGLIYAKDARILRVNDEISKIFNVPMSVKLWQSHNLSAHA